VPLDAHEAPALSVEDELVLICIHGAKHFWERLMWIADVAALVSRQTGIDWQRVADSAQAVGAERMLHTGLRLASDLLQARLPDKVQATVEADAGAAWLAEQSGKWLPPPAMRRPASSNAPHFACGCTAGSSQLLPICCDSRSLRPRKIGTTQAKQRSLAP